ncbi:Long-chain-fatty-acid--CoA ligase 1 [Gonapodya sp. JEL0774]|nr:Long-chain-fatty-acid--CoA ligase 1 [Gonapodya sp. JEL0774]
MSIAHNLVDRWALRSQSTVSTTKVKGETGIYRHTLTPHKQPLVAFPSGGRAEPRVKNLYASFLRGEKVSQNGPYLGVRVGDEYKWQTYSQVKERVLDVGSALLSRGLVPGREDTVGLFMKNTPEWVIVDHACNAYSLVSVPIYPSLDTASIRHIIESTNISIIFVERKTFSVVVSLMTEGTCKNIKHLVLVGTDTVSGNIADGLALTTFGDFEKLGRSERKEPSPPEDPLYTSTICFTSGTEGLPRGVELSHLNFLAQFWGVQLHLPEHLRFTPKDTSFSYLPLCHVFERANHHYVTYSGAKYGFYQGDVQKIFDDIGILKPTYVPVVPRLIIRLVDVIRARHTANPNSFHARLFNYAYAQKLNLLRKGIVTKDSIWDGLVFREIRSHLGIDVKVIMTASASIAPENLDFLRIVLGVALLESYGLTETTGGCTMTNFGDYGHPFGAHVGIPLPHCEIKLVDCPSLKYSTNDSPNPRGEIAVRGTNVFKRYYRDQQATEKAKDSEMWFRTGDVGELLPNGTVKIIDRVSNIFKLAQGEFVVPEKIEAIYESSRCVSSKSFAGESKESITETSPLDLVGKDKRSIALVEHSKPCFSPAVSQCFVYGNSFATVLVGVVCPDAATLLQWASTRAEKLGKTFEELCADSEVVQMVLRDMQAYGRLRELKGFEQAKGIVLFAEGFTEENELLTPTSKLRRHRVRAKFEKELHMVYELVKNK